MIEGMFVYRLNNFGIRGPGLDDEFQIELEKDFAKFLFKQEISKKNLDSLENIGRLILRQEKYSIPSDIYTFKRNEYGNLTLLLEMIAPKPGDGEYISLHHDEFLEINSIHPQQHKKYFQPGLQQFVKDYITYYSHNLKLRDHIPTLRLWNNYIENIDTILDLQKS